MDGAEGVHAVSFGYLVAMRNGGLHRDFMATFVGDDFTGRACRSVSVIAIPMMSAIPRISFSLGLSLGLTSPTMAVGPPVGVMASVGVVVSRVRLADLLFHRFTFLCIGDFNVGTTYFFVAGMALFVCHLFADFIVFGFVRHFDFRPTFLSMLNLTMSFGHHIILNMTYGLRLGNGLNQ